MPFSFFLVYISEAPRYLFLIGLFLEFVEYPCIRQHETNKKLITFQKEIYKRPVNIPNRDVLKRKKTYLSALETCTEKTTACQ